MLGFLRPFFGARTPALHAPLRDARWDGRTLSLKLGQADAGERIALDLDGVHFTENTVDADAQVRCAFAFSPSGNDGFDVMPRRGRGGPALAAAPLRVALGRPGIVAADLGSPPTLAPLSTAARPVPFGADPAGRDVVVVVPVFNAPVLVERALDALLEHTHGRARLLVIDDASPDPAVAPLLARYAAMRGVEILSNPHNRGFTATANRGIAAAGDADVVLLNADAEVGPNWLAGLRRAAYSGDDVGTATAVSDNAGAFSVPELEQANAWPAAWSFEHTARMLWQQAGLAYPELPTGNGFCLYIRRAVLDAVGTLDEAAFPEGYGEENDFCQRAAHAGWRHVIAGNVLVAHARSQSFGDERRRTLGAAGMAVLRERWPQYETEVGRTLHSFERRVLDWRVRRLYADAASGDARDPRPRLLWVGEDAPSLDTIELWTLRANGGDNVLAQEGRLVARNAWRAEDAEQSYRIVWDWLQQYAIEGLLVTERKETALEIICRMLDIPILVVDRARLAGSSDARRDGLRAAWTSLRSLGP